MARNASGSSPNYTIPGLAAVLGLAGIVGTGMMNPDPVARGLQLFHLRTTGTEAIVQPVTNATVGPLDHHNLLSLSNPIQTTLTFSEPDSAFLMNTLYSQGRQNPFTSEIFLQASGFDQGRLVRIAPMDWNANISQVGQVSHLTETATILAIDKNKFLAFTSRNRPDQNYISLFDASYRPTDAGVDAINSERDLMQLAKSDPSWAPVLIPLAAAVDKDVTFHQAQ